MSSRNVNVAVEQQKESNSKNAACTSTDQETSETSAAAAELLTKLHELRHEYLTVHSKYQSLTNHNVNVNVNVNTISASLPLVQKAGYLFKWQDREIGWGGTKWSRRFVQLQCPLPNNQHAHANFDLPFLKYSKHAGDEAPATYVLHLRGCAVRDDGCKPVRQKKKLALKKKQKVVSGEDVHMHAQQFYHVFSIYHKTNTNTNTIANDDATSVDCDVDGDGLLSEDEMIVPLLRFSTQNLADKLQWIELISEACAYCDEHANSYSPFQSQSQSQSQTNEDGNPMTTTPIPGAPSHSHRQIGSADFETLQELKSMPQPKKGTLPPVIFRSNFVASNNSKRYRRRSVSKDAAKSNPRTRSGYPPSRPMHQSAEVSYLSDGASNQNYRGLLNLAAIILLISNFRLILDNMMKHGFVLWNIMQADLTFTVMSNFPLVTGEVMLHVSVLATFAIEWALSRGTIGEHLGMFLHGANINVAMLISCGIVWFFLSSPLAGVVLMMQATVSWMKLVSYTHANSDYRNSGRDARATLGLIKDVDERELDTAYPVNVTLADLYYFWFAPTLTYQIAFPRTARIRWSKVFSLLFRIAVTCAFMIFLVTQTIIPYLDLMVKDLEEDGKVSTATMAEVLLKLAIPNTYVWLVMFYLYFHLFLNLCAEILRFGDRVFYKDWWNSSEISSYWRLWNMPVHYWLIRHVYFPCIRRGTSSNLAMVIVFAISGVFHEIIISLPFHMISYWSFIGMMGQIPLVWITKYFDKKFPGSSIGNLIFWITFCVVGQPMAILLYAIEYWRLGAEHSGAGTVAECCGSECEL
eukprot:CAMPEP_0116012008 /NCGR_PEP_ID=MMETSP0321-20121206/4883_1 /TAXON_ID=163516 /ORGANISM="Leptocylindrus danicus var. danicus, Strain B650" /LENGTH=805 /DNA_ID=CAMNT_0003481301 /DNA_START=65 /DNA_END=2483 /DNA_ORIENTATION=-